MYASAIVVYEHRRLLDECGQRGDGLWIVSVEAPLIPGQVSFALGTSGTIYVYVVSTNTIHTFRPDPA